MPLFECECTLAAVPRFLNKDTINKMKFFKGNKLTNNYGLGVMLA